MSFQPLLLTKEKLPPLEKYENKSIVVIYSPQKEIPSDSSEWIKLIPRSFFSRFSIDGNEDPFFGLEGWGNGAQISFISNTITMSIRSAKTDLIKEFYDFCRLTFD